MKLARPLRIAVLAAFALTGTLEIAEADIGGLQTINVGPNPLQVIGNGQEYTKLTNGGIFTILTNLAYSTQFGGRIKSWKVTPTIKATGIADQLPVGGYSQAQSYPVGYRPKSIDINVTLSIPLTVIDDWTVNLCNRMATQLRNSGHSDQQIFGQDREVTFVANADAEVDASGAGSNNPLWTASVGKSVTVICKKWQGSQIPHVGNIAPQPKVEHVALQVQPLPTHNGQCKVKLIGMVRMNLPNAGGKVQFQHNNGDHSEQISFTTAANKIALITRIVDIPKVDGAELGLFRMKVLPDQASTQWINYSLNCADLGGIKIRPNTPPTGPKAFQAQPKQQVAPRSRMKLHLQTN